MQFSEKIIHLRDGRECRLRSPGPRDAEALLAYLRLTSGETHYMLRFPEEITMTAQEEAGFLVKTLCAPGSVMIAAFVDGALAGNAGINPVRERKKTAHRAEFGIAVKQAFWGLGIGGALLEECLCSAAEMGYTQVELDVFSDNERARDLYRRHGFVEYGRLSKAYRLAEETYADEVLMVKVL